MRIDQLMLGKMVNSEAVGIYNIAVKVSDIPIIGITILISTMFPVISKAHLENKQRFYMLLSRMYGGLFWPISFGITTCHHNWRAYDHPSYGRRICFSCHNT